MTTLGMKVPLKERFERHVKRTESCWLWTGSIGRQGYGRINKNGEAIPHLAHRLSWLLHNGPIPDGACVCHRCDVRACVNPAHLFLGTQGDNNRDKVAKNRQARGETNGSAKLTVPIVTEMRRLSGEGMDAKAIAMRFGVNHATAYDAIVGRNWRHLP